jgi:hypothetical protein
MWLLFMKDSGFWLKWQGIRRMSGAVTPGWSIWLSKGKERIHSALQARPHDHAGRGYPPQERVPKASQQEGLPGFKQNRSLQSYHSDGCGLHIFQFFNYFFIFPFITTLFTEFNKQIHIKLEDKRTTFSRRKMSKNIAFCTKSYICFYATFPVQNIVILCFVNLFSC